jgi:hypothetical protein
VNQERYPSPDGLSAAGGGGSPFIDAVCGAASSLADLIVDFGGDGAASTNAILHLDACVASARTAILTRFHPRPTMREHIFTDPTGETITVSAKYENTTAHAHIARTLAYKPPTPDQAPRYKAITAGAAQFAELLADLCPPSPELTTALRAVEEARMRANQAIAVNE